MRRSRRAVLAIVLVATAACGGSSPTAPPSSGIMTVRSLPNEGWIHVPEGSPITYAANPPASGPHYPVWLRYQEYASPMARGYWVHNLEHGAVVFLYHPSTSPDVVAAFTASFRSLPADPECGQPRALLTPDPLLPRVMVAAVAANWVIEGDAVDSAAIRDFVLAHRNHAPEDICASGARP